MIRISLPSQAHNVRTIRASPLAELSGALGDLGTLLPLTLALALSNSISLSATLVFTGLANILTGLLFSVPLPVQPMKAIAAVALANRFSQAETAAAGLSVAGAVLILSVTGLLSWVGRVVPIPVIKGIQVGAGLALVLNAGTAQLKRLGWVSRDGQANPGDNLLWAIAAFVFLLLVISLSTRGKPMRIPYALIVFLVGLTISLSSALPLSVPFFGMWRPRLLSFTGSNFQRGALSAGLGQLPLTTLNSIIAVTHLSAELLPSITPPSPTGLGVSVAAMNLLGCPFGAMPACHGSGGLAAQHRFGARSGASVVVLGAVKLLLGLVVDDAWLLGALKAFPHALLGILVLAAGVELAKVGESLNAGARDLWERAEGDASSSDVTGGGLLRSQPRMPDEEERRERWLIMSMTIAGLLAFGNDAVGFGAGLATHAALEIPKTLKQRRYSGGHWSFGVPGWRSRHSEDGEEGRGLLARADQD